MMISGIAVSPGIVFGRAHVPRQEKYTISGKILNTDAEILEEIARFDEAVLHAIGDIEIMKADASLDLSEEELEILETHIEWLNDPEIRAIVMQLVKDKRKNANDALVLAIDQVVGQLNQADDEYIRARSADVKDIGNRILKYLLHASTVAVAQVAQDSILIVDDIAPSETLSMDLSRIIGFATQFGGSTSHSAIIAKSRAIPAVIGCGQDLTHVAQNDLIIIDGIEGRVYINPDSLIVKEYAAKKADYEKRLSVLKELRNLTATTTDGEQIKLFANISNRQDMQSCLDVGGEGVGLFRSELLFMQGTSFPSEEEQFVYYRDVMRVAGTRPVTIRTMDIGGDKALAYADWPKEENPFLGYRAIRISLDRKDLFLAQLKAILRVSAFSDVRIMFPMISGIRELRAAKAVLAEAMMELQESKSPYNQHIKIGVMIEIPSAAITADLLAREADFFSIGTNDLIQYSLAADRMNKKVADYYEPYHPAVLRMIFQTIQQARKNNISVAICGELASDPLAIRLLLGMGLKEFSMDPSSIPIVKNIILQSSLESGKVLWQKAMALDDSEKIKALLKEDML